jgi:molecular chaperone GrpE (heat shock protein)
MLPEDLLKNTRWLRLAEDCVDLFDELDNISPRLDPPRQEIVRHVKYRLQEILNRSGVASISRGSVFDETRHQLEQVDTRTEPGTPITKFISPGFVVDGRILRRAKVQVADTLQEDAGRNL